MIPLWDVGDRIRQLPIRDASSLIVQSLKNDESLVMVGATKPSLHFYTDKVVIYEGRSKGALVNLSDRLNSEKRIGWEGKSIGESKGVSTFLMLIDIKTLDRSHWKNIKYFPLGQFGIYKVLRVDRFSLELKAKELMDNGMKTNWREPRPERF